MRGLQNPHIALKLVALQIAQAEANADSIRKELAVFPSYQREQMLQSGLAHYERELEHLLAKQAELRAAAAELDAPREQDSKLVEKAIETTAAAGNVVISRTLARAIIAQLVRLTGEPTTADNYAVDVHGLGQLRVTIGAVGTLCFMGGSAVPLALPAGAVEVEHSDGAWLAHLYTGEYEPYDTIVAPTYGALMRRIEQEWS